MPKLPGVDHLNAVRAFEKAGFRIVRQGKHIVMSEGCASSPSTNDLQKVTKSPLPSLSLCWSPARIGSSPFDYLHPPFSKPWPPSMGDSVWERVPNTSLNLTVGGQRPACLSRSLSRALADNRRKH